MSSQEALLSMDTEVDSITSHIDSLQIDDTDSGFSLFFCTFEGALNFKISEEHLHQSSNQRDFKISFMAEGRKQVDLNNSPYQPTVVVRATKMLIGNLSSSSNSS